jgi:heterotetrameric sarcosine oxidase gamma subunit
LLCAAGVGDRIEANHLVAVSTGTIAAALSGSEFLISAVPGIAADGVARVRSAWAADPDQAHFVSHGESSFCFGLTGKDRLSVYARFCAIDFSSPGAAPGRVLQTRLAQVNVVILRVPGAAEYDLILGDVSLAIFLWRELFEGVTESGGSAVGIGFK